MIESRDVRFDETTSGSNLPHQEPEGDNFTFLNINILNLENPDETNTENVDLDQYNTNSDTLPVEQQTPPRPIRQNRGRHNYFESPSSLDSDYDPDDIILDPDYDPEESHMVEGYLNIPKTYEEENAPDNSPLAQKESTARPNSESEDEEPVACLTQKEPSAGTTLADTSEEESMPEEYLPQPSSSKKSKFAVKSASSKDAPITKTSSVTAALAESEDEMMEDVKDDSPATQENVQQEIASEDKRMSRWSRHKNIEYKNYLPGTTEIDPTEFYSKRKLQKLRRKERGLTAGDKWNHLKIPELTEELKNELAVFSNKRDIDPKLFYKRPTCMKEILKHFQYG